MENNNQHLSNLYQNYLANKISPTEVEALKELFGTTDEKTLRALISAAIEHGKGDELVLTNEEQHLTEIYSKIKAEINPEPVVPTIPLYRRYRIITVAAAILLASATVFTVYLMKKNAVGPPKIAATDILPGTNKAILTLADGRKINLSDAKNGELAMQTGIKITKASNGQIIYTTSEKSNSANIYNTVETPNGGEFQVILPDGSKVWLNAASSIKYPLSFGALKERRVELTGEAYFEVIHNKAKPFRVTTPTQTVEVLGTHFNVNSYADENRTVTTLEQGSVKVFTPKQTQTIKPGQQTVLVAGGKITVQDADLQTALAWKNGNIYFKDADIKTIMRQVARWYNVGVEYRGQTPERAFNGGVARTANLSSLLKILELNNIHFTVETNGKAKTLIVTP